MYFRRYGLIGSSRILVDFIVTRIFFKNARLIKFPIDIRNKQNMCWGKGFSTGKYCRIEAFPENSRDIVLKFGKNFRVNDYFHITARTSVIIGDNVLIASRVFITDVLHGSYSGDSFDDSPFVFPNDRKLSSKPVLIGSNCWIGEGVAILPGVSIGDGSIVGANSVVTKNIPDYSIAVGNPAKIIKSYDFSISRWISVND